MAKTKQVLDWSGNVVPGIIRRERRRGEFKIETDADGKKYWRAYSASGVPGDRLPVEGENSPHIEVHDAEGKTVYDSRQDDSSR